ncbi:MAG: dihydrolipoamide acetyltransferase family protein [Defluviicoccus sp.]|nr:dihydrolipoamide acetyltransferase family protein [Defluviicoccus sp.]MDE0274982.1 dihydrolipoamide acetyltransferase family protein [Defluviicoccus sp.]
MDVVMPQLGETVTEGTVTAWHKAAGDSVKADETLFEVSTDKVDTEVPAPADGVLSEILVEAGTTVPVGTRLAVIGGAGETAGAPEPAATVPDGTAVTSRSIPLDSVPRRDSAGRPLSPAVRRLIAEHGLDPAAISGTGRDGRITRQDVEALLAPEPAESDLVPLGRMRKQIAEHMVRSKATSPHVLQAVEVDFHAVERARGLHGEAWKATEGFSLSYLPFVAYAACRAIPDFPHVNASIEGEALRVHRGVHLGIAVDLGPGGLMAPVIRDAQEMDVAGLARAVRGAAAAARDGSIGPDDLAGGTYTISNSGTFGTLITAPIINQPQVAILSTDGVRRKPAVVETGAGDAIAVRPIGILAQSFDHRAIDGAYSAGFLARLREILEGTDWDAALA